jgi:hypothetical protein
MKGDRTHTTPDGFVLTVHESMYSDYGLSICHPLATEELFYSPHALSAESYGVSPPGDMDWELWQADYPDVEGHPWTDAEWAQCLEDEADQLLEAYVDHDAFAALDPTDAAGNPRGADDPAGWCVACASTPQDCAEWGYGH